MLERNLDTQRSRNHELRTHVDDLRAKVNAIGSDDRALEKAARNELGLARENELVFIFDNEQSPTLRW